MKRIIERVILTIEIIINACLIPLFKVKIFHEIAVLPGETEDGKFVTHRFDYYYSIIDNLRHDPLIIYISIGLIALSIIASLFALIKNRKLQRASHILSACSIAFFLFVLYSASLVQRCY